MSYLEFKERDKDHIGIFGKDQEYLGCLERMRVGAWMTFVLTDVPDSDIYFSASCLDDIRKKQKELNAKQYVKLGVSSQKEKEKEVVKE